MRALHLFLLSLTLPSAEALAQSPDPAQSEPVKQGMWEIRVRAEVGGQPLSDAPLVVNQCLTQTTARDLMNQLNGTAGGCQISNMTQNGRTAHWDMNCTGQFALIGSGDLTLGENGFSGSMHVVVNMAGQSLPITQSFDGHWVGPCK